MAIDRDVLIAALPGYELGDELGHGTYGVVFAAHHRQLDRTVAVKQLAPVFARQASIRARFRTEAQVLGRIDHPHIVPVHDFVEQEDICALVMDLLGGGTVASRFSADGFTQAAACAATLAAAAGLETAHRAGVLHRDIKPDNLLFATTGVLKVTDFGIAKIVGGDHTMATTHGEVIGTPAYMAPEQARGETVSAATDVYALATTLYELLSGALPFAEGASLLSARKTEAPADLRATAPAVPLAIADVVMRSLAIAPLERYQAALSFGVALAEACTSVWGPGWLSAEATPVMSTEIIAATERGGPTRAQALPTTALPTTAVPTTAVPTTAVPTAIVRATRPRPAGMTAAHLRASDLVPLDGSAPHRPRRATLIAVLLLLIAAGSAVVAPRPQSKGVIAARINGQAVTSTVRLDLRRPIVIETSAGQPITFKILVLDEAILSRRATSPANIDLSGWRFVIGGTLSAEIDAGATTRRFRIRATQPAIGTAAGAGLALLAIVMIAYAVSLLGSLRIRARSMAGETKAAALGIFVGLAFVGLAWVALGRQASALSIAGAVILAAAGMAVAA